MKAPTFRLYWLRETGCHAGTPILPGDLPEAVRGRVLELARGESNEFAVRLPFFDRKEGRRLDPLLRELSFEREGNIIRAVVDPMTAARDLAATLVFTDPVWQQTPSERDQAHLLTWRAVSQALQRYLRENVAEMWFADVSRLEKRRDAYSMILYRASRLYFSRSRGEYTYDVRDFPWCHDTLAAAWRLTGRPVQRVLEALEQRLIREGRVEMAHRYAPVWFDEVAAYVKQKPQVYASLLARESAVINSVIDLGTERSVRAINRLSRTMNQCLRRMHGMDARGLAPGVIEEAHRVLTEQLAGGKNHCIDARIDQDADPISARRPNRRIGGEKNRDDRHAHGGSQMCDSRIVTDVQPRRCQPAGQFV